ncbi:uroporphyrinogen decarboxylase family protein [Anaerolentibacter hominis]|uniref:uroporphyrinogen decarboxylase family protein n=1 Tax=Anaerolentibacter hominis TaxID=3079009 RepID=UPI0031B82BA8
MSSKKEIVLNAFHNKPAERIPVGFWFHFLEPDQMNMGLDHPELMEKNLAGHRKFKEDFDPDFVKVMTDGLFFRPHNTLPVINCAADLRKIENLDHNHPYFVKSIELAKNVREIFGDDTLIFFNIFAPLYHLTSLVNGSTDPSKVFEYLKEDPEAVEYALNKLGEDLSYLAEQILTEGKMDGLYLSVANPGRTIPAELYSKSVSPSETMILDMGNKYSENHILHICGYRGRQNILSVYRDYPVTVFNWAVHEEGMNLAEGKEYFHGKAVIGGFDQMPGSLINAGKKEDIEAYVEKLITEGGKVGVIIGADCTVPSDTPIENLKWVRDKAAELSK